MRQNIIMNELPIKKITEEVYLATEDVVRLDQRCVEFIKEKALSNPKGRARICAHKNAEDNLHEMIIAISSSSYIRPHRHHNKIESFHLIEGRADVVILNENGKIEDLVKLGKDYNFYYRLSTPHFHTLIIRSPLLVIHEITNGPFNVDASSYAEFSPSEGNKLESMEYMSHLKQQVDSYATN